MSRDWAVPDRRIAITASPWASVVVAIGLVVLVANALYLDLNLFWFCAVALLSVAGWLFVTRIVRPAGDPIAGSWLPIVIRTLVITACTATISIIPALAGFSAPFTPTKASTLLGALGVSALNAGWTAIVEECINAVVIMSAAALANRLKPSISPHQVAAIAITAGALVRFGLHLPLWGLGYGLSKLPYCVAIAIMFWFTRAVWPLILAHFLWDMGPLLAALSPSPAVSSGVALIFGVLVLVGIGFGIVLALKYLSPRRHQEPRRPI